MADPRIEQRQRDAGERERRRSEAMAAARAASDLDGRLAADEQGHVRAKPRHVMGCTYLLYRWPTEGPVWTRVVERARRSFGFLMPIPVRGFAPACDANAGIVGHGNSRYMYPITWRGLVRAMVAKENQRKYLAGRRDELTRSPGAAASGQLAEIDAGIHQLQTELQQHGQTLGGIRAQRSQAQERLRQATDQLDAIQQEQIEAHRGGFYRPEGA